MSRLALVFCLVASLEWGCGPRIKVADCKELCAPRTVQSLKGDWCECGF